MSGEESTPDLDGLQQLDKPESAIRVPVIVTEIGPVETYSLPARGAVMRAVAVGSDTESLVGRDLRRKCITLWATADTASGFVYIGTDQNEVESGSCARLPALVDTYADGAPVMLTMTHNAQVWVRNAGANPVRLNYVAEYWAD